MTPVLHTLPTWFGRSRIQCVSALVLAASLSGCAYSPGTLFGPTLQGLGAATAANSEPSTLARMFQGKGGNAPVPGAPLQLADGVPDVPPPGVLRSITPELIQQLQREAAQVSELATVQPFMGVAQAYTLGVGDVVHINVWGHPELVLPPAGTTASASEAVSQSSVGNGFNLSPEGLIQFPLIGTIKLAGLTENQARLVLTQALAKYIVDPQVTLRVQAFRAGRVYLDGEVKLPGLQAINDIPMTLPEAISRAGGLTATADRAQVQITRQGVTTTLNMVKLAEQGVNPAKIMLQHNDLVRVASRDDAKVYVMGEVVRQAALPLRNGRLSLNEALGESGGINPTSGDPRQVFVIRSRSGTPSSASTSATAGPSPTTGTDTAGATSTAATASNLPEIFHLDARSPMGYALAEGFELKARDVVFVDPVPLVRWNRVISLILPSAQAVSSTRSALN